MAMIVRPATVSATPLAVFPGQGQVQVVQQSNLAVAAPTTNYAFEQGGAAGRAFACDGQYIVDEVGNVVCVIKRWQDKHATGFDLVTPTGQPILRFDKKSKHVKDLRTNRVVAGVGVMEKSIYHGDPALWKTRNPPRLWRWEADVSDGINWTMWIYDAKTTQHVATLTRPAVGETYPSRVVINPNVPYHMLLCACFLV
jgi:hypothetical protein